MTASPLRIATRKSPLALAQTAMVAARLEAMLGVKTEELRIVTTGDRQTAWSLEQKGGKGLFTGELEAALLEGRADIAVHSTKDLPGEMPAGLVVAGYLPRANPCDVLVMRSGIENPHLIATGSPRRRLQLRGQFADAEFIEIRGNVDTRLRKIGQDHVADATVLAAAGLARLGIDSWPEVEFYALPIDVVVPAVGQAAIAIQCRAGEESLLAEALDAATARAIKVERAFQSALGSGCHTAFAAHVTRDTLYLFHEDIARRTLPLSDDDFANPAATADRILRQVGLI